MNLFIITMLVLCLAHGSLSGGHEDLSSPCHWFSWDWEGCRQATIDVANDDRRVLGMGGPLHAGEYLACNHMYTFDQDKTIVLNPSSYHTLEPWFLRNMPSLEWECDDDTLFRFGSDYNEMCRDAPPSDIECYLSENTPARNQSITSLMGIDPSQIDRYLNVTYWSPRGEYLACNHMYTFDQDMTIVLNPSSYHTLEPWFLRNMPSLEWECDDDTLYTVMIKDAAVDLLHGVMINIPCNALEMGDIVRSYSGPIQGRNVTEPHVFMVFDQQGVERVELEPEFYSYLSDDAWAKLNVSFLFSLGMKGPVAMNWFLAEIDPYSVQYIKDVFGWYDNCALFVEQAFRKHNVEFLPYPVPEFTVNMEVDIRSWSMEYDYCCEHHYLDDKWITLDPIGNASQLPEETRAGGEIVLNVNMKSMFPDPVNFTGKMYTMLALDVDLYELYSEYGNSSFPYLYWVATDGYVGEYSVLYFKHEPLAWQGPTPINLDNHTFYFLLLEQTDGSSSIQWYDQLKEYSTGEECSQSEFSGMCMFNTKRFINNNNLDLVSASWMETYNTNFANYTWFDGEENEVYCGGADKWPCPLPPIGAASLGEVVNIWVLIALGIAGMFMTL